QMCIRDSVRTGARLGGSNGLLSHYRVFTRGRRYGGGAWDWPCRIRQLNGTSVEILWEPEPERQFEMRSRYEFVSPTTVELRTTVVSSVRLEGFEVFLASYFSSGFTNSMVLVKEGGESGEKPSLRRAVKSGGDWQMFVRGDAERKVVSDGRWKLPPNPVEWVVYPLLAKPVAIRHAQALGLGAVLVGDEEECFAVATPHETEGHYSVYLCLWGRDIEPGKQTSAQTRLVFVPGDANTVGMAALAECGGGNGR
ncbi:MAG: hypothetical protein N3G20_03045, partial [Verrucomicrobiae bacterium]|nr:hypothetical protein [Verrucomicrobiae bacterium]